MTAGNNGTPDPGNDDPFAYLYRQEGADPGQTAATTPNAQQPRMYNQVRAVGDRRPAPQQPQQYGQPPQQAPQSGYGYPPQQPPQAPSQYATQQLPYDPDQQQGHRSGGHSGGGSRGHGGGPNSKGLLIGAIAVVAAVSIGIGVAMANGDSDAGAGASATPSASAGTSGGSDSSSDPSASSSAGTTTGLGAVDAAAQTLSGGATKSSQYADALASGGEYVAFTTSGATMTWTVDMPKAGKYTLYIRYANGEDDSASATTVVNGKAASYKMDLKKYVKNGDWTNWYKSYQTVNLTAGSNTIAITCGSGDTCHFNLDQVALTKNSDTEPDGW